MLSMILTTEDRVIKVIARVLGIKWHSDINVTDVIHLECYKALEKEFNITFSNTTFFKKTNITVKEACDYITSL